jgi:hypothetical protein
MTVVCERKTCKWNKPHMWLEYFYCTRVSVYLSSDGKCKCFDKVLVRKED